MAHSAALRFLGEGLGDGDRVAALGQVADDLRRDLEEMLDIAGAAREAIRSGSVTGVISVLATQPNAEFERLAPTVGGKS